MMKLDDEYQKEISVLQDLLIALTERVVILENSSKGVKDAGSNFQSVKCRLIMAERFWDFGNWVYLEHIAVPIKGDPHMAHEAWAWMESHLLDYHAKCIFRIYYHEKHGWVGVYGMEW